MLRSSCLAQMSPPKHTLFTFRTKVRTVQLSFLATRYQAHASWLTECTKILLTVCMRPAAIALKECHLDLRNNVQQIIYIYIYHEKSQLNTLVWGLLTLAQLRFKLRVLILAIKTLTAKSLNLVHAIKSNIKAALIPYCCNAIPVMHLLIAIATNVSALVCWSHPF